MKRISGKLTHVLVVALWATSISVGAARLWRYESVSGDATRTSTVARRGATSRGANLPTLVVSLHPHCPCSRATVGEMAKLMTDCQGRLLATVLVFRPRGAAADWERTSLWSAAASIPGVAVLADEDARESRHFGAATSGQVALYGADGRLLFAGGITESRGHSGDNAGRSAITAIVLGGGAGETEPAHTPVYGCSLFDDTFSCQMKRDDSCRN